MTKETEFDGNHWKVKNSSAQEAFATFSISEESQHKFFWLETKPNRDKKPAAFLKEPHSSSQQLLQGNVVYMQDSESLEPVLDLREKINSVTFGPFKAGDQSVLIKQDADYIRLFFESCSECVDFVQFILYDRYNDKAFSDQQAEEYSETEALDRAIMAGNGKTLYGWSENFKDNKFTDDGFDGIIDAGIDKFFLLEEGEQKDPLETQLLNWKTGLRWYNRVSQKLSKETSERKLEYFKVNFCNCLTVNLVKIWNEFIDKFNFDEMVQYYGIVHDITKLTDIYKSEKTALNARKIAKLLQAIALSAEAYILKNYQQLISNIIEGFWSKNNFEFFNNKIISKSCLDIMKVLEEVRDHLGPLSSRDRADFMRQICVE